MTQTISLSGHVVDLTDPDPNSITVSDVAAGLAGQIRWGGRAGTWLTVAQHSLDAAALGLSVGRKIILPGREKRLAVHCLLHDVGEAYLGDITTPAKEALGRPRVDELERRLVAAVRAHLGVAEPLPCVSRAVESIDGALVILEWESLSPLMPIGEGRISHDRRMRRFRETLPHPEAVDLVPYQVRQSYEVARVHHPMTPDDACYWMFHALQALPCEEELERVLTRYSTEYFCW